jgi:hypothetical protein
VRSTGFTDRMPDDFAGDPYDHAGLGFIGGASLHVRTERHAIEGAEETC